MGRCDFSPCFSLFDDDTWPLDALAPFYSMTSPSLWNLTLTRVTLEWIFGVLAFLFMFEAIFWVIHDLSNLYHGYFMFLGALRVYSTMVSSYKKASAISLLNNNSHLWRIIIICLLLLSLHYGVLIRTFGRLI
jgi:hypothetical protein